MRYVQYVSMHTGGHGSGLIQQHRDSPYTQLAVNTSAKAIERVVGISACMHNQLHVCTTQLINITDQVGA